MKVQVRNGVFETNSSSTHSLSIFKQSDWARFEKGEMVMEGYPYTTTLVDINSVDPECIYNPEISDSYMSEYDYITYEAWKDQSYYEEIFKDVADYKVMSLYGYE